MLQTRFAANSNEAFGLEPPDSDAESETWMDSARK